MLHDRGTLRRMLSEKDIIYTVGVGDAMSAKLISSVDGIDAILSSGFAVSAQAMGLPDAELYTRSDNVYAVSNMCYVSSKPVIADIDTGYGNAVTVIRTVREFERAGASGVIMEDQYSPKRCPICVTDLNAMIPAEEAAGKIRAAAENRLYPETVIIARTDAVDREEQYSRAKMYLEAGADLVQGISKSFHNSADEIRQFVEAMEGRVSLIVCGPLDTLSREDIAYIRPKICQFALLSINYIYPALKQAVSYVAEHKTQVGLSLPKADHEELVSFLGMPEAKMLEEKYIPKPYADEF
ncbi:MAG: oxaloacetate decarboxylase [Oscillospiraceae bacterium]